MKAEENWINYYNSMREYDIDRGCGFALIGFCRHLVCANLRKGYVSSLVYNLFFQRGERGITINTYKQ